MVWKYDFEIWMYEVIVEVNWIIELINLFWKFYWGRVEGGKGGWSIDSGIGCR